MDKLEESFEEMVMKSLEEYIKCLEFLMTPEQIKEAKKKSKCEYKEYPLGALDPSKRKK